MPHHCLVGHYENHRHAEERRETALRHSDNHRLAKPLWSSSVFRLALVEHRARFIKGAETERVKKMFRPMQPKKNEIYHGGYVQGRGKSFLEELKGSFHLEKLEHEIPDEADEGFLVFCDAEEIPCVPDQKPTKSAEEILGHQLCNIIRDAKEKHLPVLLTNDDESRGLFVKDINDLNIGIEINGVKFEDI